MRRLLLALVVVAAGCASAGEPPPAAGQAPESSTISGEGPVITAPSTTTTTIEPTATTTAAEATTTTAPERTSTTTAASTTAPPALGCIRIADFGLEDTATRWRIVNDGVMGGLSDGVAGIVDGRLLYEGLINTNGGGFSSIRGVMTDVNLSSASALRIAARSDGRSYEFIIDDAVDGRDRRVNHFGAIPLAGTGDWEEVEVALVTFDPRFFGAPVDDVPIDPAQITEVGIILADGIDGPFRLEVRWIDACA